jgi:SAM-dependent methyltransferase
MNETATQRTSATQPAAPWETDFYDPDFFDARAGEAAVDSHLTRYLTNVASLGSAGEILELGCGTGRLTRRLLERGHRVFGVDVSERMLEVLRSKAAAWPAVDRERLQLARGDVRNLRLKERFAVAVAPDDFLTHFLTPECLASALRTVRDHLHISGRLLTDFRVRRKSELAVGAGPGPYPVFSTGMVHGVCVGGCPRSVAAYFWKQFAPAERLLTTNMIFDVITTDGKVEGRTYKTLRQRLFTSDELEGIAKTAGFSDHHEVSESEVVYHEFTAK